MKIIEKPTDIEIEGAKFHTASRPKNLNPILNSVNLKWNKNYPWEISISHLEGGQDKDGMGIMPHVLDDKSKENFIANKDIFTDRKMFEDIKNSMNSSYTDLEYKNFIKFLKEFSSRKNIDLSFLPEHFKKWCNL